MKVKVRCIQVYKDKELLTNGQPTRITPNSGDKNYERIVNKERADKLVQAGVCEIITEKAVNEIEPKKKNQ